MSYCQGTKCRKFWPKYRRNFGSRWRSIKYLHRNFDFLIFPDIFRHFSIFSRNFHFFPVFSFCSLTPKISKKCFLRVLNPPKMPGSGTLQPPSHSLHLLYIVQTFFIFSDYLFVHNPYHHLIIIFYFIFILHYNL